jgi:ankyrin repeat protein
MILAASPDVAESCRPISLALLDAGADIDATDEQGRTALDISVDCHNTTLTEILRSHQHQGRQLCP